MNTQTRWFLILGNISFLSTLFWFLWWCQSGIEFGDEGFYLNWMKNPWEYSSSITQFGFVYHPLFTALGESIVLARITNILITFVLSFFLSFLLLERFTSPIFWSNKRSTVLRCFLCFGFSLPCLAAFFDWNGTPSYNSLSFQGLILTSISLLVIEKLQPAQKNLGCTLLSLSGFLVFLGKPSTAALLAPIALGYLFSRKQLTIKGLITSLASLVFFFLCTAFLIDGSVPAFLERYQEGLKTMHLLGGHGAPIFFRGGITFWLSMGYWVKKLFWFVLFLNIAYFCLESSKRLQTLTRIIVLGLALSSLFPIIAQSFGPLKTKDFFGFFKITIHYIELFYFVFFMIGATYYFFCSGKNKSITHSNSPFALSLYFLVLPYVFAFGSNRSYLLNGAWAGIFWVLGGLSLLLPIVQSWKQLLCFLFSLQLIVVMICQRGLYYPFRQTSPLFKNTHVPRNSSFTGFPRLSEPVSKYLEEIKDLAYRSGFRENDPIIDLTGRFPTTLFYLEGRPIGAAWFIGGFPGSEETAKKLLENVPCKVLSSSWVLIEPGGLSSSLLGSLGLPLDSVFSSVGKVFRPMDIPGFTAPGWQTIYKANLSEGDREELCKSGVLGKGD